MRDFFVGLIESMSAACASIDGIAIDTDGLHQNLYRKCGTGVNDIDRIRKKPETKFGRIHRTSRPKPRTVHPSLTTSLTDRHHRGIELRH